MEMAYKQITRTKFTAPLQAKIYSRDHPPFIDINLVLPYSTHAADQVQNVRGIIHSKTYDIISSTDGSSTASDWSSLGHTGAGAVIHYKGTRSFLELKKPICTMSNNYEAELYGIDLAMDYLLENQVTRSKILFLVDLNLPLYELMFVKRETLDL